MVGLLSVWKASRAVLSSVIVRFVVRSCTRRGTSSAGSCAVPCWFSCCFAAVDREIDWVIAAGAGAGVCFERVLRVCLAPSWCSLLLTLARALGASDDMLISASPDLVERVTRFVCGVEEGTSTETSTFLSFFPAAVFALLAVAVSRTTLPLALGLALGLAFVLLAAVAVFLAAAVFEIGKS